MYAGQAHVNGIESFWSMLKRGYYGTFHRMSPKHLNRYVSEFLGPPQHPRPRHDRADGHHHASYERQAATVSGVDNVNMTLMRIKLWLAAALVLTAAACSGTSEPEVVAYPLTADQVAAVKEAAGQEYAA